MPRKNNKKKRHNELDDDQTEKDELEENFTATTREKSVSSPKNVYLDEFSINAHNCQLFVDADLHVAFGHRVGLIGRNGEGKTTLLKHLAEKKLPIHPDMDVLYVEQEVAPTDYDPVYTVLSANQERFKLLQRNKELEQLLDNQELPQSQADQYMDEWTTVSEKLQAMQADRDEAIVKKLLRGLGFSIADQSKPVKLFSGGWRMRISLARALYLQPTLLLLDEPTNHLDLHATIWLTNYLSTQWKTSLLVVSHNQDFLNEVCTHIIHLEEKKLIHYNGNYDSFEKAHTQKQKEKQNRWDKVEKKVALMKKKSVPRKQVQDFLKNCGEKKPEKPYVVHIRFHPVAELSPPVIQVYEVDFDYTPEQTTPEHYLFQKLDFGIGQDTRAVIVGPNGVGKSTLINLLVKQLTPIKGEVRHNNVLRIGYYNQHFVDFLPLDQNPVEYLISICQLSQEELEPNPHQALRGLLGRCGLPGRAHLLPIGKLSGGQKARVAFCALYVNCPHIIFLDEPTNHLDIESINGLIEGINDFNGGIVMVSHDVKLITQTNAQLWVCGKDHTLVPYQGTYEDYKEEILEELESDSEE